MGKTIREDARRLVMWMMYSYILWFGCLCVVSGYRMIPMLSELQMQYIRKIFRHGDDNIKSKTRAIVAHHYIPWVQRFCGDFAKKHRVMGDKLLVDELYQSGYLGFMESLENYNGAVKIHYYSGKYIHGRLCKVMRLRGKLRQFEFVPYAQRWKLENAETDFGTDDNLVSKIHTIMMNAPREYKKWFFARYDCENLRPCRSVGEVCTLMDSSHETYRRKMKKIEQYVREEMVRL